ncbi:MAG: hypothetical protein EA405_13645 [Rhodospirillales bacterium]|nr:MAG: hypothetical protein EA405_13645 [Rhodospirillales bacterium]
MTIYVDFKHGIFEGPDGSCSCAYSEPGVAYYVIDHEDGSWRESIPFDGREPLDQGAEALWRQRYNDAISGIDALPPEPEPVKVLTLEQFVEFTNEPQ